MKSRIYTGEIYHARLLPVKHVFTYPVYFYAFDLEELEGLGKKIPFFSHNRFNLVSLLDKDYLERGAGSIREKLLRRLKEQGCQEEIGRIELITTARYFGYVFNPASFFYCYNTAGKLVCTAAQVNNTFGEMHLYVTPSPLGPLAGFEGHYETAKDFHVSPFFDRKGVYEFKYSAVGDTLEIQVNLKKDGHYALVSRMTGKGKPLTAGILLKTLLSYPFSVLLTIPRIHWQAAKLYFQKKLPVYSKPAAESPNTLRTQKPKWREVLSRRLVENYLKRLQKGRLEFSLPEGETAYFGAKEGPVTARIRVRSHRFFWRLVKDSGIGLGEGFVAGDWDTDDLTAVLRLLVDNKSAVSGKPSFFEGLGDWINRHRHLRRKNTLLGSRKNIEDHYDLSNDFFRTFLDESMMYSSGIYQTASDTLYASQQNKLQRILDKARITAADHVLEIGFGWGGFAIKAVRETGCRVTGITLSSEQLKEATERVRALGLQDRIDFKLCDYRKMEGKFDRIVSIEMLEAVGHEYLGTFFETCDRLLKPDGLAVIQTITIPDQRYDSYRRGCDWIQKHIFPGGHLPSLQVLCRAMTRNSDFFIEDLENIGPHYARTLNEWRQRFKASAERIEELGFDSKFMRKWEYYLCYCEAGFAGRYLNDIQIVLTRAGNPTLDSRGGVKNAEKLRERSLQIS